MNELNRIYEAILLALGNKVAETGRVTLLIAGKEIPLLIDGRELYLPISEALNNNSDQRVYFHPACESIVSKETEIFKLLRRMTAIRLLMVFRNMVPVIFDVATKKEKKSWPQSVHNIVAPLAAVKKNVRDEVFNLFARMSVEIEEGVDNRFIHFKVTKGGKGQNNERVYYKAKPSYPLYDLLVRELARTEGQSKTTMITVNNYSMNRESIELAVHLFRTILPSVNNPDQSEYDATIPVAARFTAFMYCFGDLCEQINRAQNVFRAEFDKKSVYSIDLSWQEKLEDIPEYHRQVPELDYNSHNVYNEGTEQQQAIGGNMGNLFNITSTQTQQPVGNVIVGNNIIQPGQVQQQQQVETSQIYNGVQYITTPPIMQNGDRYQKFDINANEQRVYHYALDMQGMIVVYICSRTGNLLWRQPQQMQQQQYGYNNGYGYNNNNGYGYNNNNNYGYNNQPVHSPVNSAPDPINSQW